MHEIHDGIYIGSKRSARENIDDINPDGVVALCQSTLPETTTHTPIQDGLNKQEQFDRAVSLTQTELQENNTTIIYCKQGQSRSIVVTATALATQHDVPFSQMLDAIKRETPDPNVSEFLVWHANDFLGNKELDDYYSEYDLEPVEF